MTAPVWQSRALIVLAILATIAVEFATAAYNYQSASRSQLLDTGLGFTIQTDVLLKTLMSVAAGASVVIGSVVMAHHWRKRNMKGRMGQAIVAIIVTVFGFVVSVSNLSGYFAWVRDQRAVEVVRENPLYRAAAANAERVARGELPYLSGDDRRILREAQQLTTAEREPGDVFRAIFILGLVAGMATGYRLTEPSAQMRWGKAEEKPKRRSRATARRRREDVQPSLLN